MDFQRLMSAMDVLGIRVQLNFNLVLCFQFIILSLYGTGGFSQSITQMVDHMSLTTAMASSRVE